MKFSMRAPKLMIGLLIVALILAVSVFTDFGFGSTDAAEADRGPKVEKVKDFHDQGGFTESFGGTWTGWD